MSVYYDYIFFPALGPLASDNHLPPFNNWPLVYKWANHFRKCNEGHLHLITCVSLTSVGNP